MKINKDSIVTHANGVKLNIKLEEFLNIVLVGDTQILYGENYLDDIIEYFNDTNAICYDSYYDDGNVVDFDTDTGDITFRFDNNDSRLGFRSVLEKIFKEDFYRMEVQAFKFDNIDDSKFKNKRFLSCYISNDKEVDIKKITKDFSYEYSHIKNLKPNDFLTAKEKEYFDSIDKRDDVNRSYDSDFDCYHIRKKDFNKDKWWLGWTCEDE